MGEPPPLPNPLPYRHMSFSDYEPENDEQEYDRFRKRRLVTNIINEILPKCYHPHQDVGLDEKVFSAVFICFVGCCLLVPPGASP